MTSCVYLLRHKTSKRFYIGSTKNADQRRASWKQLIRYGRAPFSFAGLSNLPDDWQFEVLEETTVGNLAALEAMYLAQALRRWPHRVLNKAKSISRGVQRSTYYDRRRRGLSIEQALFLPDQRMEGAKTKILDEYGQEMTQAAAAARLGCKTKTLAKRLRSWRKNKGTTEVDFEQLKLFTKQYRIP